jgi:NOL1/NOP2/fmu family ribosome biogenesis protein
MQVLNSKERKVFYEKLNTYFGLDKDFELEGVLLVTDKNKYYLADNKFKEVINQVYAKIVGLYIAEINEYGEIRLSIEGSQILGPHATAHLLELSTIEARQLMEGVDLDASTKGLNNQYYILYNVNENTKNKTKDFLGCGKVKEGKLLNFTPKGRRLH